MDDLIFWAVAFLVVGGSAWLVGFFRAGRALREIAELRRQIVSVAPVAAPVAATDLPTDLLPALVSSPQRSLVDIEVLLTTR